MAATILPFGLIVPSRPVLTSPTIVSLNQYAFTFPSVPAFSHIVVFLMPGTTLPEGSLAGVYMKLPGQTEFKLLGAVGAEKQSAIFRISSSNSASLGSGNGGSSVEDEMTDVDGISARIDSSTTAGEVIVGISVEPIETIAPQLEVLQASQSASSMALVSIRDQQPRPTSLSTKILAQRIIGNAFNFLASFAGSSGLGGQEVVPLKSFQDWWTKFERRIENDPGFLEREDYC